MSLRFYMDHHVPGAITRGLRRRGIDCVTAEEDGMARLEDEQLLERATSLGRVLVTQDEDLLQITADWFDAGREFSGLVYARQLKVTIGQTIRDLEIMDGVLGPFEMRNVVEFLPL